MNSIRLLPAILCPHSNQLTQACFLLQASVLSKIRIGFMTLFLGIGIKPLSAADDWRMFTPSFHHTVLQFQLPGNLETVTKDHMQFWKAEADGNCYWVAAKPRQCSQGKAPLKICDVTPLLRSILQEPQYVSERKDPNDYIHMILKDAAFFYYTLICSNDEIVVVLITKTPHLESPDHQRFIESFAFSS